MESIQQIKVDVSVIMEDISDFIDENVGIDSSDVDEYVLRLEEFRTLFRSKNFQLRHHLVDDYQEEYGEAYDKMMSQIKECIKAARDRKVKVKLQEIKAQQDVAWHQEKAFMFQINETIDWIKELESYFKEKCKVVTARDEELVEWGKELPANLKLFNKIGERYHQLLKSTINNTDLLQERDDIEARYEKLSEFKICFVSSLKSETSRRELGKEELHKEARLNIKLSKFSGYDSQLDIYTFQSEFEKLYLRSTPKRVLPDLLMNNFLAEPATSLVKNVDDIDEIWDRLKASYGDPKMLLNKKLSQVDKMETFSKTKDPEKMVSGLSRLINSMKDLLKLAVKHRIEKNLFYGDAIERIYMLMGDQRVTKWLDQSCDQELPERQLWQKLISFLEKEVKVQQRKMLLQVCKPDANREKFNESGKERNQRRYKDSYYSDPSSNDSVLTCSLCGDKNSESDHIPTSGPRGLKIIQYFSCKAFVHKTPAQRFATLREKGYCVQCLFPGANGSEGKHKEGKCQRDFICPHSSHQRFLTKKHVLVCEEHKDSEENHAVLQKFKSRCISRSPELLNFSKELRLSFHADNPKYKSRKTRHKATDPDTITVTDTVTDRGIYLLQTIQVNHHLFNIFYDNGCSDCVVRIDAVNRMNTYATQEYFGEINLGGIGDTQTQSTHGIYQIKLPLSNSKVATLSGICLDRITQTFPVYPLQEVERDIQKAAEAVKCTLPRLPKYVGGEIDIMIGIKYLRYHPKLIFQLPSGLAIYESMFQSADGTTGVVGGPHQVFTQIQNHFLSRSDETAFFSNQYMLFKNGMQINPDVSMLGYKLDPQEHFDSHPVSQTSTEVFASSIQKSFIHAEEAGSEISYRCVTCRQCKACKNHDHIEAISIKEEAEQAIINASVKIDQINHITSAYLPFIHDPSKRLAPNKNIAMKVYNQQLRKLNDPKNEKDKTDILESEAKLQNLGFVDYLQNLEPDIQEKLKQNYIQNYIPWRAVWKSSSISTPCRIVFDASQITSSGYSLNDMLAKGRNNLNRLQEILIRWTSRKIAIHTDIQKMYNTIKLDEKDWCFQRYIWQEQLDPTMIPEEKIIKTLIYGVKSSGNQAEHGLREVARLSIDEFPEVNTIIQNDVYVDDCITGETSKDLANIRADQLELVMNRGGFHLKGISFSGEDPPDSLSDDGVTINVAGMKWFTKDDVLSLNISELNFSRKHRGKKSANATNIIPSKLTRRHCTAKVAEIFDLTGKITPITASMKLDLHELVQRKLHWDDTIPDDLRPVWMTNFQLITEINNLRYRRTIIPEDAISLDIDTIDTADASQALACVAIYARMKRRNGEFSCQLVLSRSRIVPTNMTQPRAELFAATLNAHTGEVVRKAFNDLHKSSMKLSDSQIVLHWINNEERPLKQWVRNRVVEIRRFTSPDQWFYVQSKNMIADFGTRKGASLNNVSQSSSWINGLDWMKQETSTFPIKCISELKMSNTELSEVEKESPFQKVEIHVSFLSDNLKEYIMKRYQFSNYLIDPNKFSFSKVVRVMATVLKFIKSCQSKKGLTVKSCSSPLLTEDDIKNGELYFFQKCTDEVTEFLPAKKYEKISVMKDGILVYNGRILPTESVSFAGKFTESMKDLASTTFCVPLVDKYSPVAYSIINDVHWNNKVASHSGVETTLRYILKKAFIIEPRSIIKSIRKSCQRCRYLIKKTIDVAMGPVSRHNLTVAPSFYVSQVDLSGPYKAYSSHQKRTTIKIWLVVFCCCTTSATSIKVMDDYSTTAFIQAFTRFACDNGYPKILLCDEGSQLVKASKDMKLNFKDLGNKLFTGVGVEFNLCPVGGHNMHGKVERRIKHINESLVKTISNERLSLLQWETVSSQIANSINDLPLALGNVTADFETMDLLTPNRLKYGRNNERSPVGNMIIVDHPGKIIKENERIFISWFENWLLGHVPQMMNQEKWFVSDNEIKKGDVVLFLKQDSSITKTYQYGMVEDVEISSDGLIRKAKIKYRNLNESSFRYTNRSVRSIVTIKPVDEIDITSELGKIASIADVKFGINTRQ